MATITYESPDGVIQEEFGSDDIRFNEETGHWRLTVNEDADGNRVVESVPRERVYSVREYDQGVAVGVAQK